MALIPTPSHFSDIFKLCRYYREKLELTSSGLESLLLKRDFLIFALLYTLGSRPDELLSFNFKQIILKLDPSWSCWLREFQEELESDRPWFHTARHASTRDGLSRRGLEQILNSQAEQLKVTNWSAKSLRQAHLLKLLQNGVSVHQIRYKLDLSESFNFKPFEEYALGIAAEDSLYAEISAI